MMPQSGDGYLAVREKALWLEPYHWRLSDGWPDMGDAGREW